MPAYRYLLCDLLTDQPIADLPLTGVTFERRISRTGSLTGGFGAPTSALIRTAQTLHANVGRSALWVYRDNELWWGGIPWTAKATQNQRGAVGIDVQAATFDSYAHHRQLYTDLDFDRVDQGVIIPTLWRTIQADRGGDIGVRAVDQPVGVLRDRSYFAADQDMVGRLIEDLGDIADGPEHVIDTYAEADGTRVKRLRVAQRLGQSSQPTVFQRSIAGGGRVLEWTQDTDATTSGTTFQVRADTDDSGQRIYATDLLTAGWPLLDVTQDVPATDNPDTGVEQAWALAMARTGAVRTSGYTVQVGDTGWSPNRLGDEVRLKIADRWHAEGQLGSDRLIRPVGVRVTTPTDTTAETVELLFGEA